MTENHGVISSILILGTNSTKKSLQSRGLSSISGGYSRLKVEIAATIRAGYHRRRLNVRKYTIILAYDPEAKAYAVTVPALPACTSQGDTIEETIANSKEAIAGHVEALREIGEPLPEEVERLQAIAIDVAARN